MPLRVLTCAVVTLSILLSLTIFLLMDLVIGVDIGTREYDTIARNLADGQGFILKPGGPRILWRPPLYIFVLAFFYRFMPHPYTAMVSFQIILVALTALVFFRTGESIVGRTASILSALFLSAHPLFVINVGRLMPEILFALMVSITFLLLRRYFCEDGGRWPLWCGLGLVIGIGSLLKASYQFLLLFLVVWVILFYRRNIPPMRLAMSVAVMLGVMLSVLFPWTWRNYRVSGEVIIIDTSGGYTVWVGNRISTLGLDDDPLTPEQRREIHRDIARILGVPYDNSFSVATTAWGSNVASKRLYAEALRNFADNPIGTARLWLIKLYRFWFSYVGEKVGVQFSIALFQVLLLLFALAGLWFAWRDHRPLGVLVMLPLYFQTLHMMSTANVRYTIPILGHVMLLAAYGVLRLTRLIGSNTGNCHHANVANPFMVEKG